MATRDFNRLFGDCFEPAGPVEVTGRGTRDSFTMVDSYRCRPAMPGMANSVVLADSQTVLGHGAQVGPPARPCGRRDAPAPPDAGG